LERHADLLEIGDAVDRLSAAFGVGHGRQQHRRQNRNNGDDHQKFNQCKAWGILDKFCRPTPLAHSFHTHNFFLSPAKPTQCSSFRL
jgi:hypothetical protein